MKLLKQSGYIPEKAPEKVLQFGAEEKDCREISIFKDGMVL